MKTILFKMRSIKGFLRSVAIILGIVMLNQCASTDDGESNYNYNYPADEFSEAGENYNNATDEDFAINNSQEGGQYTNNAYGYDDYGNYNNAANNSLGFGNYSQNYNLGENGGYQEVDSLLANEPIDAPGAELIPNEATALDAIIDANTTAINEPVIEGNYAATEPMANTGERGKVKYVINNTSIYNAPNGNVVNSAEKGDHPVIYEAGNFARLADGRFIRSSDLSNSAVGRERFPGLWQSAK